MNIEWITIFAFIGCLAIVLLILHLTFQYIDFKNDSSRNIRWNRENIKSLETSAREEFRVLSKRIYDLEKKLQDKGIDV